MPRGVKCHDWCQEYKRLGSTTVDLPVLEGTVGPLPGNSAGWLPELVLGRLVGINRPFVDLERLHSVS